MDRIVKVRFGAGGSVSGVASQDEPAGGAGRKLKAAKAQISKSDSSSPVSERGRWRVFEPEGENAPSAR